jgi:uncharacterized membrane protein
MKMLFILAAALPVVLAAGAANAASFSGNYAVTISHSKYANGPYCLTLTDNGGLGWPHSGQASLTGEGVGGTLPYGTFQLMNNTVVVTIQESGDSGQNAGLVFSAPSSNGNIAKGIYDQVYGGEEFDSGLVAFGAKGGC